MMDTPFAVWGGCTFGVYPVSRRPQLLLGGGIYIFAKAELASLAAVLDGRPRYSALYIGETESFADRLRPAHERWFGAALLGMTHIHLYPMFGTADDRRRLERALRRQYQPFLNPLPLGLDLSEALAY